MKCVTLLPEKYIYTLPIWILIGGYLIMAIVRRLLIAVSANFGKLANIANSFSNVFI